MSLECNGVSGHLSVTSTTRDSDGNTAKFDAHHHMANKSSHLEGEKQLLRDMLEEYLRSDSFKAHTYQLQSEISIKFNRSVNLVMPRS